MNFSLSLLKELWDARMAQGGVFLYDLNDARRRTLPEAPGIIVESVPGRAVREGGLNRPSADFTPVLLQPSGAYFNFCTIARSRKTAPQFLFAVDLPACDSAAGATIAVHVNYAPIDRWHFLAIPDPGALLPQHLNRRLLGAALALSEQAPPGELFLGFNSLGAFASVNHGHFHGLISDPAYPLPIENAAGRDLVVLPNGIRVAEVLDYPAGALVFTSAAANAPVLAEAAAAFARLLQREDIPPIAIVRPRTVYIGASSRVKPPKLAGAIGSLELAGRLHARAECFGDFTAADAREQLALGTLPRSRFMQFVERYREEWTVSWTERAAAV